MARKGGRNKGEEAAEASFAGLTAGRRARGELLARISRKMRRGREGKHDGERGGAFTASTYL